VLFVVLCVACAGCSQETHKAQDELAAAGSALRQRDFMGAEQSFERYLRRNPQGGARWEAWHYLVHMALTVRHDRQSAIELLEAMRIEYADAPERLRQVIRQLGGLYKTSRQYNRAVALWTTLAEDAGALAEERAEAYRDMAEIHLRRLEFESAKEALEQCLQRRISGTLRGQCIYDRAQIFMAEDNIAEALVSLREVLALEDASDFLRSLSMFMLADALEQQGNFGDALQLFTQLRGSYPNTLVVEKRIGFLRQRMKTKK
jgi:tetratricopeptide (TPR) repeat protein